jgi:hypothetical protein
MAKYRLDICAQRGLLTLPRGAGIQRLYPATAPIPLIGWLLPGEDDACTWPALAYSQKLTDQCLQARTDQLPPRPDATPCGRDGLCSDAQSPLGHFCQYYRLKQPCLELHVRFSHVQLRYLLKALRGFPNLLRVLSEVGWPPCVECKNSE